jgi:hypothetical protein
MLYKVFCKEENVLFQVLRVSFLLQDFKFKPKFLSYLTGHCWGTPTELT